MFQIYCSSLNTVHKQVCAYCEEIKASAGIGHQRGVIIMENAIMIFLCLQEKRSELSSINRTLAIKFNQLKAKVEVRSINVKSDCLCFLVFTLSSLNLIE